VFTLLFALVVAFLTPCATEDSTNCHWDASVRGNGTGHSFIDLEGTVYYLN